MPLRLKSLELHGYKTFAAKTNFEFAEGITAIVGPNGSGKSNIADALRWVLGEQTYSLLRAKKTEDMIFAGSEQRPRSGMASAGITFDNDDGWLPVDFSEVSLSRRAYRDGRNEYLLNSQHVRLKDINELLAQSGLSERTYTILGQGLVDASLSLKADERRRLFEEAAGIGLYRTRREESLRRLENSRRNLDRVLDILAELEPRLKSLERQSARAQEYSQVQADLRVLLHEWYGFHWHLAQNNLTEAIDLARSQKTKLLQAREAYQTVREEYSTFRDRLNGLRARLNSWHRQSAQLHENRESVSKETAMLEERQRALMENRQAALSEQSRLAEDFKIALEKYTAIEEEVRRFTEENDEFRILVESAKETLEKQQKEKSILESDLVQSRGKLEDFSSLHASLEAHLTELTGRLDAQKKELETVSQNTLTTDKEASQAGEEIKKVTAIYRKAETALRKADADSQIAEKDLLALELQGKEKQTGLASIVTDFARDKAQLDVLEQADQSLAGYADGARKLLDAARQSKLGKASGALSAALDVPPELEVAISAALGEFTDAILLNSGRDAQNAMDLLDDEQSGRASILTMDWLSPIEPLKTQTTEKCLGVASNLVTAPAELQPVLDLLLGQVLIVKDRTVARRILAGLPMTARAVTLQGEVFHASGQVLAGKPAKAAVLGRSKQKRKLMEAISRSENRITDLEKELHKIIIQIESAHKRDSEGKENLALRRAELEKVREEHRQSHERLETVERQREWLDSQKKNIDTAILQASHEHQLAVVRLEQNREEISLAQEAFNKATIAHAAVSMDEFQAQVTFQTTKLAVAEQALKDAQRRLSERTQSVNDLQEQQALVEKRLDEIKLTLTDLDAERGNKHDQAAGMNAQLEELRSLILGAERELETSEAQEQELLRKENEGQTGLARIERMNNQILLDQSRKQEILQTLRQRIEDDFGLVAFDYAADVSGPVPLPFDGMVDQLPVVTRITPDLEENINRQRAQLRRMGAVNLEAQVEYKSVKERHGFLTIQVEDLRKAEADLHKVIAELDALTRQEFRKTFDAVAGEFHVIFHRLFGGGSARLTLTDPENLTETGIDIEARLPGRREQGLSLLSGGERSLTAIALVFALLKVSPTPVCVLDEVDAMLDEANVGRFRDLLLELSKETQFIIITHNRNTVQAADVIYGVTMGRDSASQIISLKLDQVSEEFLT